MSGAVIPIIRGAGAVVSFLASLFTTETATAILVVSGTVILTGDTPINDDKALEDARKRLEAITASGVLTEAIRRCKKCPASTGGVSTEHRNFNTDINMLYQAQICKFPYGPGWIFEWNFAAVSFDGFILSKCLLQETKGQYDQFFSGGDPVDWWSGDTALMTQAIVQYGVAMATPPDKLAWYFMQLISYRYYSAIFKRTLPTMSVYHIPYAN